MGNAQNQGEESAPHSDPPGVAIVLVSWNSLELMRVALASISSLDIDHELIVVDNASSDGSADAIE